METAVEAARIGGAVLISGMGSRPSGIDEKATNDYVTDVDRASQRAVVDFLRARHPDHSIVAEEDEQHAGTSGYRWYVDPLDGTMNYIHSYPFFCVSVGLWRNDEPVAGAIFDPVREEMFQAERGAGAWLGDRRIRVSDAAGLQGTLLVTGFPFRILDRLEEYLSSFQDLFRASAGVRRDGSAALDLCYVACGRVDAFWELGLSAWDLAAGAVMVQEAGGVITDYAGGDRYLENGNLVAASPAVHAEVLEVLQRHHPDVV